MDPHMLVELFSGRRQAIQRLGVADRPASIPDSIFHWAHYFYLNGTALYLREQPRLASNPDLGRYFTRPGID
jgi:hypothetical protein